MALEVITGGQTETIELPDFMEEMNNTIDNVNEYAWNRGLGLDWGMDCFNEVFEGLHPGFYIVGGQPNVGKSSLCLQMAWNIAKANRVLDERHKHKAYVMYFSLDDTVNEILPRIIANEKRIPINAVRMPEKYRHGHNGHAIMTRREAGFNMIKELTPYFKLIDPIIAPGAENIETIASIVASHNAKLKEYDDSYKLVIFIDNLHDIQFNSLNFKGDNNGKYEELSIFINNMSNTYDVPIICTAEFRKLNGPRRPTTDDVREAGKTGYKSKGTILCYNEVGLKGGSASVYWHRPEVEDKQPVLEAHVAKNKMGDIKRRYYFEFIPEYALCKEATREASRVYDQMVCG